MLIDDIEYVIFQHPDLEALSRFMEDFGLLPLSNDGNTLYMRTYGDAPLSYVSTKGDAKFVGMGFRVASPEALHQLAQKFNTKVIKSPHPGGGDMVCAHDPDGRELQFVYGAARLCSVGVVGDPIAWNDAHEKRRLGTFQRPKYGPSHAQRLGHLALFSPDPQGTIKWYCDNLGLRPSELIYQDHEDNTAAAFLHVAKGNIWTDHHTVAIIGGPQAALEHISFEVQDFDDLGMGNMFLTDKGYHHRWGIGRHFHGSQVFDYWHDTAGFHVEHFTDGDLVNDSNPTLKYPFGRDTLLQWGAAFPG